MAIHKPKFCHEFITVVFEEKGLTSPCKIIKKCKTTKIRTAPLVGSSIPVFSDPKRAQDFADSMEYQFLRNGYFISDTKFEVHGSLLHFFNSSSGHPIQPCKQSELDKYVFKTKRKKCCSLNRITNKNKVFHSLLEDFYVDILDDIDMNQELLYFLDLDEEPNSVNISLDKNLSLENFHDDIYEDSDINKEVIDFLDVKKPNSSSISLNKNEIFHSSENFHVDICKDSDINKELYIFDLENEEPNSNGISLELCMFYFEAIRKLIGKKGYYKNTKCLQHYFYLIRSEIDAWCKFHNSDSEFFETKDTHYYRTAYLYRNSTCISSAVAHHFLKAISQHFIVLKELFFKKKELRICSISGGSPLDVIAIIKVLKFAFDFPKNMDIYVSVIAIDKKWKNAYFTVLQCSEHFRNATWKIDFIDADCLDLFNDKVMYAIKTANIVSIVKFFSELDEIHIAQKFRTNFFRNVHELAQPETLIYVLDFPMNSIVRVCGGYSGLIPEHSLLYETLLELYTLDEIVVERLFLLYKDEFPNNLSNCSIKVFARLWLKSCSRFLNFQNDRILAIEKRHVELLQEKCAQFDAEYKILRRNKIDACKVLRKSIAKEICSGADCAKKSKKEKNREVQEAVKAAKFSLEENLKLNREARKNFCEDMDRKRKEMRSNVSENMQLFLNGGLKKAADTKRHSYQQSIKELLRNLRGKYSEVQKTRRKF
ncbi:uncharacterized protein TNCV_1994311 [Trichonephila clavipes]|nr:uncharacterized protein TNCV_1994311 [Trichonephila clavipes]